MRKVIVTGAGGFLGRHLVNHLADKGFESVGLTHSDLDITDSASVAGTLAGLQPDIVVHCAAISSTGYAKEHPDESMAVNVEGSVNIALACRSINAKLFVMSSDQVYGGCTLDGPLPENLDLRPNSPYGAHKLLMEKRVLDIYPDAVALRLAWMFETYNPVRPHIDIISRLTDIKSSGEPVAFSTRELRGIADVEDVCRNMIPAFDTLKGGVYNFGSENRMHTWDAMLEIAANAGIPAGLIIPDNSWGRNISMDISRIRSFGIDFPDTVTAVVSALRRSSEGDILSIG